MTVEETPLPQVRTGQPQRPRDESFSLTLAKVREVTGASDEVIKEAIRVCTCKDGSFKVEDVVTTIIEADTITASTNLKIRKSEAQDAVDAKAGSPSAGSSAATVAVSNQGSQAGQTKATSATGGWKQASDANDYIDLTRDSQGILGGQISREEQDISRVLEASLAESKGSTKRKRGELWFVDPLNPHERKRSENWPVGLRNVGNTCWFSAVIQSLFHIQKFRNIVLNYKSRPLAENENNHKLRFVCELRQLFGLMVGSHRKYVDPSMAVNILKEASAATALDGQQDVSEFQHKLLDWLEDAFSVTAGPNISTATAPRNPVHQLFQGKYKAEGFNQGKAFSQEVTFGQYPLNVIGFRDIHESLEATTAQGEIETVSGDSSHKSGQEIWFTHLPVVLTFELSRFGFNQQLNRAEKIHQQLSFPPVIYVDRYLECNKTITRQKREEARKLKEELAALQAKLDSSPGGRRAAWSPGRVDEPGTSVDVEMKSPGLNARNSQDVSMTSVGDEQGLDTSLTDLTTTATTTTTNTTTTSALSTPPSPSQPLDTDGQPSFSNPHSPSFSSSRERSNPAALTQSKTPCTAVASLPFSSDPSPASPAPEAKKFKDSSVQVEFEPRLMPITVVTNVSQNPQFPAATALSSASPLPPLSQPTSSSTSAHPSCSTSTTTTVSLTSVDPSPLTPGGSSTLPVPPHPRSCSSEELLVLQACLRRWRQEVEMDVRELQRNISSLENQLDGMYSEDCMKQYPYHLHAVLVHEGQAVSGHYWSFIHDWHDHHHHNSSGGSDRSKTVGAGDGAEGGGEGRWLKFNDITVSESSLAEVQREGVGGFHNASAYCLMYIDRSRLDTDHGNANSSAATSPTSLPEDLQRVVEEDNLLFQQEILQWDEEQRRKTTASLAPPHSSPAHVGSASVAAATSSSAVPPGAGGLKSASTSAAPQAGSASSRLSEVKGHGRGRSLSGDPDVVMTGEQRPGESSIMRPVNSSLAALADAHARLSLQATLTAVTEMHGRGNPSGNLQPRDIFKGAMEREMMRLKGLSRTVASRLPSEDPRLSHIVLYLLTSGADSNTVKVILAEQFALCGLLDSASTVKGLRQEAQESYRAFYTQGGNEGIKHYEFWHKRYSHYRQAVFMFTEGISAYIVKKYQEALPYFNQACLHNSEPGLTSLLHPTDGLNPAWLTYYRRGTLQRVNEQALQSFERDDDLSDSLTIMTKQILPTLAMIGVSQRTEDQDFVEGIRSVWCQFLEKNLTEEKVEKLQEFLSKMFEAGSSGSESLFKVRQSYLDSLSEKYTRTMRRLKETGDLAVLISLSS
ncbi:ubiquitin carboxyl-terminal hydrolase 25-like [Elysia marginata]|uniref:Ubiquitin carboxyl-terminal hydrolase 25-like n=1 Tax=Elysia marginata TaxID=1093978 RepID=A0AAV4GHA8_9GAST|nr:ubiquitin carboxyl-terminal hydrolase 25-like [Elysia marginata]